MLKYLYILLLATLQFHCSEASDTPAGAQNPPGGAPSTGEAPNASAAYVHFFSVAWGCVQVEASKLADANYMIQDYSSQPGACPPSLTVLDSTSRPLLQCPVVIGPSAIPASYVLYDKRTLDGRTVRDLRAEGFTEANFCPAIAARTFN